MKPTRKPPGGAPATSIPLVQQWLSWMWIGATSFGGGAATLILIRREWVDRRRWIGAVAYDRALALSQVVPGITILALAIQLGRFARGYAGILVALVGLLTPSVVLTGALTAAFSAIQSLTLAHAALLGVAPGTGGLTAALALQVVVSAFSTGFPGWYRLRDLAIVAASIFAIAVLGWPAPVILIAALAAGAAIPERSR